VTVRDATPDDLGLVAGIAAASFEHDPLMRWVFDDAADRIDGMRMAFWGLASSYLGDHSVLHVVDDACVTMWRTSAYVAPPVEEDEDDFRDSPFAPVTVERFRILGELMAMAHPHAPHWYLNVIATLPDHQGRGLGARALAPVLERCDAERMPAYLESSNPRNMTLYRRHGFEEIGDTIDLPDGPSLWPMWREPR
jgi:ribosomal protein S18 acetylase RimI-like enzyme